MAEAPSSADTSYNHVLYPSAVYPQTHPGRLAALAALFQLETPPVERCRVLELGCGDGTNLISLATQLPEGSFYGIDIAERPIESGCELIAELGLRNVELRAMDLLRAPENLGRFDYIIAHGLYSWVPAEVREQLMFLCGQMLAENGVAYISYNAYPGNHLRDLVRGMMRYHAAHFDTPDQKVRQSRALLKFVSEAKAQPDLYHRLVAQELERTLKYSDSGFYHDDLSALNQPVYFHEFAAHAARHQLQYLGEADYSEMREDIFPPSVLSVLNQMGTADIVAREQYLDFLRGRAFRQSLLCRRGAALTRPAVSDNIPRLYAASSARPQSQSPNLSSHAMEDFENHRGMLISVSEPSVKQALARLGQAWPGFVSVEELAAMNGTDRQVLSEFLLRALALNFVDLNAHPAKFTTCVSEKPLAAPLVRAQLKRGNFVSTGRHEGLRIGDALGKHLLLLLDGTRDREALLRDLETMVQSGDIPVFDGGQRIGDPTQASLKVKTELEPTLERLARSALLLA